MVILQTSLFLFNGSASSVYDTGSSTKPLLWFKRAFIVDCNNLMRLVFVKLLEGFRKTEVCAVFYVSRYLLSGFLRFYAKEAALLCAFRG